MSKILEKEVYVTPAVDVFVMEMEDTVLTLSTGGEQNGATTDNFTGSGVWGD